MTELRKRLLGACAGMVIAVGLVAAAAGGARLAGSGLTGVAAANPKAPGVTAPNVLSPELTESAVAQGSTRLENGTAATPAYGYLGNGPFVPLPGTTAEAQKTEPDKNTYLVFPSGLPGADPSYDYGKRFLFQGHEAGSPGQITRINLDADGAHRVTLLATQDVDGKPLPTFDGSTWDPWARRLLFTAELGANGGVWAADLGVPAKVEDVSGALGRGGYEGIQDDSAGNLWIVEDVGGPTGAVNAHARQPNSFLYRYVPARPGDLRNGRLQVLQVLNESGQPIVFHAGQADADIRSADARLLYTYGTALRTRWITIHDTAIDGTAPFGANALAKALGGTPFKRPENGVFRPDGKFREFFFDATGDTNALTEAGAQYGGFGGIFKLTQKSPSDSTGTLTLFYRGDVAHTGLDNAAFLTKDEVVFVEDAGDTLHTQRNALDSAWLFDVGADYSSPAVRPTRIVAQGRDASATLDSGLAGTPGFSNDGDNEITGFHVSDGDPGTRGILGAKAPHPFQEKGSWRVYYTQQHGDNTTFEIRRS